MKRSLYDLIFTNDYVWERNGYVPKDVISIHAHNLEIPLDNATGEQWYTDISGSWDKLTHWKYFPCVVPPFERCFIEYYGGFGRIGRLGVMCQRLPFDTASINLPRILDSNDPTLGFFQEFLRDKGAKWILSLDCFGDIDSNYADYLGITTVFGVKSDGGLITGLSKDVIRDGTLISGMIDIPTEHLDGRSLKNSIIPKLKARLYTKAIFTLSLMNCKNTELIDHDPTPLTKKQKKQGQQVGTVYKTIKVHPMRKVYQDNNEEIPTEANEMPLHIIRGHFKDFRNGAGLFGKFRDIFWWEQQVRGKPENGRIIKDYDVHPE